MAVTFNPEDHYWLVGADQSQVYSSKRGIYVPVADATYVAWAAGNVVTSKIDTETELWDLLAAQAPIAAALRPEALDKLKDFEILKMADGGIAILAKMFLNHENRIRTLAGQPTVTMAQFKTGVKALL